MTPEQQAAIAELFEVAKNVLALYQEASTTMIQRNKDPVVSKDALDTSVRVLAGRIEKLRQRALGEGNAGT